MAVFNAWVKLKRKEPFAETEAAAKVCGGEGVTNAPDERAFSHLSSGVILKCDCTPAKPPNEIYPKISVRQTHYPTFSTLFERLKKLVEFYNI